LGCKPLRGSNPLLSATEQKIPKSNEQPPRSIAARVFVLARLPLLPLGGSLVLNKVSVPFIFYVPFVFGHSLQHFILMLALSVEYDIRNERLIRNSGGSDGSN